MRPNIPVPLIGLGIRAWQLVDAVQADLFEQHRRRERDARVRKTIYRTAERFAKGILQLGCAAKRTRRRNQDP